MTSGSTSRDRSSSDVTGPQLSANSFGNVLRSGSSGPFGDFMSMSNPIGVSSSRASSHHHPRPDCRSVAETRHQGRGDCQVRWSRSDVPSGQHPVYRPFPRHRPPAAREDRSSPATGRNRIFTPPLMVHLCGLAWLSDLKFTISPVSSRNRAVWLSLRERGFWGRAETMSATYMSRG